VEFVGRGYIAAVVFAFAFLVVIPSVASEPAFSRSLSELPGTRRAEIKRMGWLLAHFWHHKRKTGGSGFARSARNDKPERQVQQQMQKRRFPAGMTTRKAKAKAEAEG
jgi:hypothetical protein